MAPHFWILRALVAVYLVTMMFWMGLELGGEPPLASKAAKRTKRRLLAAALLFNLVVVPFLAFSTIRVLNVQGEVAIGLLIVASAAGGRFAPHLTKIAGGDLGLSVETTLFLAKLTAFTAPVTASWLLRVHRIEVHELQLIAALLLFQLAPYLAGRLVRRRRRELADRLARPTNVVALVTALAAITLQVAIHRERASLILLHGRGWLAVLTFALATLALGWLLGPTATTRRAIGLSGNARELALALMLAHAAFPTSAIGLACFGVWFFLSGFDLAVAAWLGQRSRRLATAAPA
jgi:BASS family bile acid:Na+ symporter